MSRVEEVKSRSVGDYWGCSIEIFGVAYFGYRHCESCKILWDCWIRFAVPICSSSPICCASRNECRYVSMSFRQLLAPSTTNKLMQRPTSNNVNTERVGWISTASEHVVYGFNLFSLFQIEYSQAFNGIINVASRYDNPTVRGWPS